MLESRKGIATVPELFEIRGAIIDIEVHLVKMKKMYAEIFKKSTGQTSDIQPPLGDESRFDWY